MDVAAVIGVNGKHMSLLGAKQARESRIVSVLVIGQWWCFRRISSMLLRAAEILAKPCKEVDLGSQPVTSPCIVPYPDLFLGDQR